MKLKPQERLATVEQQMKDARTDISDIKKDVRLIRRALDCAHGGYKLLLMLAAFSGAIGALISKLMGVWVWR